MQSPPNADQLLSDPAAYLSSLSSAIPTSTPSDSGDISSAILSPQLAYDQPQQQHQQQHLQHHQQYSHHQQQQQLPQHLLHAHGIPAYVATPGSSSTHATSPPTTVDTMALQQQSQQSQQPSQQQQIQQQPQQALTPNTQQLQQQQQQQLATTGRNLSGRYALSDFKMVRTLGTGSFGRVHLVMSTYNSRYYAIKVLKKEQVVRMKQVEHTNSERAVLSLVRHPFLVNLWGTFADSTNLYMVMDFIPGGELFTLLRKSGRFPPMVAKFYSSEVALAIDYLHQNGFIYRDLKPENILLASDGHVKITDFGFAKWVPDVTWTLCGTPDYLAPEIVSSKGYNKSVDWWAFGVLLFEMLAGHPPFFTEDGNPMKLYEKITACKVRYPPYFEPSAKDLLKNILTADLTKRYGNLHRGSKDIFGHAWFQEVNWDTLYNRRVPAPYIPTVKCDGDDSQFERYEEGDYSLYGITDIPDHFHHLFPDW